MISRKRLLLLLAVLIAEPVIAVVLRLPDLREFLAGAHRLPTTLTVAGVAWLVLVVMAAVVVGRSLQDAQGALFRQGQVIEADVGSSRDWIWQTDSAYRLTYSSAGVTDALGYAPEELIGCSMLSLLAADQVALAEDLIHQPRAPHERSAGAELNWMHVTGHLVALATTAAPMRDHRGRIVGFRGASRFIPESTESDRRLADAKGRICDLLANDGVNVALQPVIDLTSGRMIGVEALARFDDDRGPEEWFQEARDTGLGIELDRVAFRNAIRLLSALPESCYLSVNASPGLLVDGTFVQELATADIALDRLVIEITEHVKISSYSELHASLAEVRERGARLAIDDTGAGYASMHHVLQLRPDIIKIDRSLIADVTSDAARRTLVTAFVLLALELDATVTGEGIETPAELETLASLGVDCAQGYLLAKPTVDPDSWFLWGTRNWLHPTAPDQVTSTPRRSANGRGSRSHPDGLLRPSEPADRHLHQRVEADMRVLPGV